VFDNIALGLKIRRISKGDIRIKVEDTLGKLELSGLAKRYPSQLSGGQQQRVAVARAIVLEPEILLFDEPLSNLDARIRERVRGELHDLLRKLAVTTLYVTHDKAEAMAISDRIVVMRNGVIEQVGDSQEIYERPASTFVADFIGRCNLIPVKPWSPESGIAPLMAGRRRLSIASETEKSVGIVGFRPEVVQFGCSDQAENTFVAHLEKQIYFGNTIEIIGRIGGTTITVNAIRPVAGETFAFHVPPDQLLFFEGNSEVGSEAEVDIIPSATD
jgi:iron(III) transport system ATP-binding protein